MVDLSIIIVNYNVKEFLLNLLQSLKQASKEIISEVIVVDNASDDNSAEIVREKYPDTVVIANKENVGFGKANNQGMEIAKGRYILLINPDTIVKEDTFTHLIKFLDNNPEVGMAGCKVLNSDGSLQLPCRRSFPGPWTSFTKVSGLSQLFPNSKLFAKYNLTYLDENQSYEVDAVSGAFMFMRREVYEKTQGFDPQFFMYGEDLDLCYRTQQAGYKVFYYHKTEIIHYKGESTKRSSIDETKVFYEAMQLFVKKHLSSSFLVGIILQFAIVLRKILAFLSVNKLIVFSIVLDVILFLLVFIFSEYIYRPGEWTGFPPEVKPWIYIVTALLQVIISSAVGAYKKNSFSVLRSWISLFIGITVLSALTFFFKQFGYSRAVLLITYAFLSIGFPIWRITLKLFFKIGVENVSEKSRTLIVGTGDGTIQLGTKINSNPTNFHKIVGLIGSSFAEIGNKAGSFEVIGSLENIRKIIHDKKIDKVIFNSKEIPFSKMFTVVSVCNDEDVEFLVAGSELDYMVGKSAVALLDNISLMKLEYNITQPIHKFIKFVFDKVVSVIGLVFVFPFVFFANKLTNSESDFKNFILQIPKVLFKNYSFVGPKAGTVKNGLYLGKEGITGLWFTEIVNLSDFEEVQNLNLYYAKNQNIWLDLEILGKAFSKMFIKRSKK